MLLTLLCHKIKILAVYGEKAVNYSDEHFAFGFCLIILSTLYEYLQTREKLQNPVEQERLLHEIPQAIAEDLESESPTPDVPEDGELESSTPHVPDKRVENNSQELRKSTCKQASLVTDVPKAVVPDKRVENNLQELWETTSKKAYLVSQAPKAVADGFLLKATKLDIVDFVKEENNSPKSTSGLCGASKVPPFNMEMNSTVLKVISRGTAAVHRSSVMPLQQQPVQYIDLNDDVSNADEMKISKASEARPVSPSQLDVIDLSDGDEGEKPKTTIQVPAEVLESLNWYYRDPQGSVQGPFSLTSLKRWSDGNYFPPNFMVWKAGQSQFKPELLVTILHQFFPSSSNCK
ncbi:putative GYF-like domain-containing protein [Lupinus albus]|uniref:Putative GYF-like domain-containing protein n=1 Tax=Lupinus albus TaxID=3870 RepID=A0A6A4NC33_LUPAL|nr:putative GYF-like domain-containing protein [Lupinus albus]